MKRHSVLFCFGFHAQTQRCRVEHCGCISVTQLHQRKAYDQPYLTRKISGFIPSFCHPSLFFLYSILPLFFLFNFFLSSFCVRPVGCLVWARCVVVCGFAWLLLFFLCGRIGILFSTKTSQGITDSCLEVHPHPYPRDIFGVNWAFVPTFGISTLSSGELASRDKILDLRQE